LAIATQTKRVRAIRKAYLGTLRRNKLRPFLPRSPLDNQERSRTSFPQPDLDKAPSSLTRPIDIGEEQIAIDLTVFIDHHRQAENRFGSSMRTSHLDGRLRRSERSVRRDHLQSGQNEPRQDIGSVGHQIIAGPIAQIKAANVLGAIRLSAYHLL
jgi:hypothetical protein